MNNFILDDQNDVGQTGINQYAENTEIGVARLLLVPKNFEIATRAAALTLSTYTTAVKAVNANRMKPLKIADLVTPADVKAVIKARPFLGGKKSYGGKNGFIYVVDSNIIYHNELLKLEGGSWAAYIVDGNGNIKGISPDGVKFNPRKILSLFVNIRGTAKDTENENTEIEIVFADVAKGTAVVVNPDPTWSALTDIDGVHNVDMAVVGNWSATGGVFTVKFSDSGRPVTGLVAADFVIPGKTISTVVESTTIPGQYTLVGVSLVTVGTINLTVCASISITYANVESTGAATFTIP